MAVGLLPAGWMRDCLPDSDEGVLRLREEHGEGYFPAVPGQQREEVVRVFDIDGAVQEGDGVVDRGPPEGRRGRGSGVNWL